MQAERPSSSSLLFSSPSLNAYPQVQDDQPNNNQQTMSKGEDEDSSGGFDFSFDCAEAAPSPIPADRLFHNGRIRPIYEQQQQAATALCPPDQPDIMMKTTMSKRRKALQRLFTEETQQQQHSSSSDQEELGATTESESSLAELESVPSESYCVWEPPPKSSSRQKGSSKRWKLMDLLTSSKVSHSHSGSASVGSNNIVNDKKVVEAAPQPQLGRKLAMKEGGGRRSSYLPYRQELVGIFGSGRITQQRSTGQ